ncbi:class I SAM-dependent methyltransferase [Neisseria zoodegmatis]|uniref:Methyltransferase n=1 Tax=Neisseria zoodegmatis TaxID=326523 RepID=A0AB38DT60_9NEIS|nr:class I SAM-dependent methyltransferase [Neisseria zoodegmatis]OSI11288.1 methyltransferase [Neisseria zoodegmatis]SNU80405.1 O-Methyltransferase involved in polyketide biosynthesis [Neisseria zoodegmatis]
MDGKISPDKVGTLSETMLITLWAKAVENDRPDALLRDEAAARMMKQIDYDFSTFARAKMSQPGCCGRAALMDNEIKGFLAKHPDAVVVQLGAGLDARFERLGKPAVIAWYDLDLPEVIELRRQLLPEDGNHYLAESMFNEGWMDTVAAHGKPVLLVLEGVLMYFDVTEVQALFAKLIRKLPGVVVVFDIVPAVAVGKAKYHDTLKKMNKGGERPEFKWSVVDVSEMEKWLPGLRVEHVAYLSDCCGHRYPWIARLLYRTRWGKRNLDQRIVRIALGEAV